MMESGKTSTCDYKPLQLCLEKNGGKKELCEKEWREFQSFCTNQKRSACT